MFEEDTLEVKFTDGSIHIKKPTENIALRLLSWVKIKDSDNPAEMLEALRDMTKTILNHNTEGKEYTDEQVISLGTKLQMAICTGYKEFMLDLEQNPNS
jgi:hypothetical protein